MLIGIIPGEVTNPFPAESLPFMESNWDVLCWLLRCEHNRTFGDNRTKAEVALAAKGFVLERRNNRQ